MANRIQIVFGLLIICLLNTLAAPAMAANGLYSYIKQTSKKVLPLTHLPVPHHKNSVSFQPETLLLMPSPNANKEEICNIFRDLHITAVETIGSGSMQCIVLKVDKKNFFEIERKLAYDSHFRKLQRNYNSNFAGQ